MELAEGGSLKNLLKSNNNLSIEFKIEMIEGVAEGLRFLHQHNIIHGDLKSENILLDKPYTGKKPYPTPKICDFGLSKISRNDDNDPDQEINFCGTLRFMAPETLNNGELKQESDIFMFGMTIYEIITQSSPYMGMKQEEIILKKRDKIILPDISYFEENSQDYTTNELKKLIIDCTKFDPDDRIKIDDIIERIKVWKSFK